ncbi:MAG: PilZ domain-containing protein [Gemmataceae bacterium]|nr:PilZ domain-containing protein [Gemmataceae bacterium]
MFAQEFNEIDWTEWAPYIGPAVGLVLAGLILLFGLRRSSRNRAGNPYNFTDPPAGKDEPNAKADPFVHGATRERRSALRRGGNPVPILISDAEVRNEPSRGWVVDRSTGGLCLSVPGPVPEGSILSVRTTNAPNSIPWVQIEVKNCRAVGKEYELGCRFVRTPPWSVMLLFG